MSELARRRNHQACCRVRFSRHGPDGQPSWWSLSRDHRNHYFWASVTDTWLDTIQRFAYFTRAFLIRHETRYLTGSTLVKSSQFARFRDIYRFSNSDAFCVQLSTVSLEHIGGQIRREMLYLSNSWELWDFWFSKDWYNSLYRIK